VTRRLAELSTSYISSMNDRQRLVAIASVLLVAVLGTTLLLRSNGRPGSRMTVATMDVPVVMHTSGGRLEVATVTATEVFKLDAPPKTLLGVDLGRTVSHVQASVVYRFHIEMAKEWPIRFFGTTAVVEAGQIKPTLPVAFDTSTVQKQTKSGWARFDKHENLDALERRMSSELEKRAHGYSGLALESARKSVGDFVRTWLIKEAHWKQGSDHSVQVVFPGEFPPSGTLARPPSTAP
jgi:hypothetical protein